MSNFPPNAQTPYATLLNGLDQLRVAVTLFDAESRVLYANQHFAFLGPNPEAVNAAHGRALEDLVETALECVSGWTEGIMPSPGTPLDALRRHRLQTPILPFLFRLTDGRWIEFKERPLPDGGSIALWTDVTALNHARMRLEDAFEDATDGFAFWDQAGRLVSANETFLTLHELPELRSEGPLTYGAYLDLVLSNGTFEHPVSAAEWRAERLHNRRLPREHWLTRHRNGTWYMVRERRSRDGGRVTLLSDITSIKATEIALADRDETLRLAQDALLRSETRIEQQKVYLARMGREVEAAQRQGQEAKESKTTFTRAMGHELRTPLNAIIGFADLIRNEMLGPLSDPRYRDYAKLIYESGNNLLAMLTQILDLTKLEAGEFDFHFEPLNVGDLVSARLEAWEGKASDREVSLELALPDNLTPATLDETALAQALDHILDNAIRYTSAGGTVRIAVEQKEAYLAIQVEDTGIGIPTTDLSRVLKPFEQGRAAPQVSDVPSPAGAGLGLTLADALVAGLRGRLEISSKPEEGTCVCLRFGTPATPITARAAA